MAMIVQIVAYWVVTPCHIISETSCHHLEGQSGLGHHAEGCIRREVGKKGGLSYPLVTTDIA
jgi:hypothetical protein